MNQRRQTFCEYYIKSGNAADAAKEAGYSARTARSIGQRLLTNVDIQDYIRQRNEEIGAENTAEVGEIRQFWTGIIRDREVKITDRLKASELLAKTYGVFMERFITERQGTTIRDAMGNLSVEELRTLIDEFGGDEESTVIYLPDNERDKGKEEKYREEQLQCLK